ncbi:PAS domain S-box protein [Desulfoprunum benzoelyticum]|uniref:histidine kinase n=1 Tax=Desulfoprunum benzoelyticum TaxID=1506996 RepID=A0A840UV47_9BACT|nr:ATP-binding protein [Desulfoprunum benzoelyticum]MBB5348716.1 PAS domain S-box-containing protein [Desulfoprunum benzoelyticum]MBM9530009.1 PAS domain S-box protein [Desulfoprunum benzoelyticum]
MRSSLIAIFDDNKPAIIAEWVHSLRTQVSEMYANRPEEEITATVTEAYEAFITALFVNDFRSINSFIEMIARMRLMTGFPLSDVQMAFELFRSISIPLLIKEIPGDELQDAIQSINQCLTHTIHRFSDLFQSMQQEKILKQNQFLEEQVRLRTAELKESEQRYKILVEEINDGFFVIHDEVLVFVNSALGLMHGYQPSQMIGQKFWGFVDPRHRKKVKASYFRKLATKDPLPMLEYLRLARNGESYPTEIFSKVTEWNGRVSVIGICRDITTRVELEQKIRESERMADIGRMTTSLSHEIRNPLSAVQMNLQILKKNPLLQGNDQKRVDISVREVKRLEKILQELLDFAKPIRLNVRQESVNDLLRSSIELLEMKLEAENIILRTDLDPNLPPMTIDGQLLIQAVLNLLLNAVEASSEGKKIHLRSQYDKELGEMVEIMVSDEGPGIPEKIIGDIFKPFFTTRARGTGLGLNNVKRIAEAHMGRVEVRNGFPNGVCFTIQIPVQ